MRRAHDLALAEAVEAVAAGDSRMLILVGSSSTGKTRACWEAVQPLAAQGWWLWHPYDPTRAEAALADLKQVAPRTVVWFNEAQHYFGHPQAGERIAAALHSLLTCPDRRPVLVLGTLWREYADSYAAQPQPDGLDPHSRVRELLAGRTVPVPDAFDQDALNKAEGLARGGDRLLADALTRADGNGRVAQDLAGAPELLRRYEHGTPPARALLEVAMDARRLGAGLHLPQAFLMDAATDYLTDHDYDELTDDWAQTAFVNLARPGHGKQAPLRRTNPRPLRHPPGAPVKATAPAPGVGMAFRLADYLEQHGRITRQRLCPPASFWHAAHTHLAADDLNNLSLAAEQRYRLRWAHDLSQRAADEGDADAWIHLADLRMRAKDLEGAEALARQAADAGNPDALTQLARIREAAGDLKGAEAFAQQAAAEGRTNALTHLAGMRERDGDLEGAEAFAQQAVAAGDTYALTHLARIRERAEDLEGAEAFAQQAADAGHADALTLLADLRMRAEDLEGAEAFARKAAGAGRAYVLTHHARKRGEAGDLDAAETLARQAADAGHLIRLVQLRRAVAVGDLEGGEAFARQAAAEGYTDALTHLAQMREAAGDLKGAEDFAQLAATAGDTDALTHLARIRERAEDLEGAEDFARQAAASGQYFPLLRLAWRLEAAGNLESAEGLLRQAADAGRYIDGVGEQARWPHGLDPDGSPTPPWN
ncbi:tetratricopeptide repeat protein [Streptomyces sp. NPDC059496]|uniref:tetratricopeptide repeat protein n=1 Tax=Streptomyces sp. NPDC059496 TaxID=3346851 RepID=UPI0036BB3AE7